MVVTDKMVGSAVVLLGEPLSVFTSVKSSAEGVTSANAKCLPGKCRQTCQSWTSRLSWLQSQFSGWTSVAWHPHYLGLMASKSPCSLWNKLALNFTRGNVMFRMYLIDRDVVTASKIWCYLGNNFQIAKWHSKLRASCKLQRDGLTEPFYCDRPPW